MSVCLSAAPILRIAHLSSSSHGVVSGNVDNWTATGQKIAEGGDIASSKKAIEGRQIAASCGTRRRALQSHMSTSLANRWTASSRFPACHKVGVNHKASPSDPCLLGYTVPPARIVPPRGSKARQQRPTRCDIAGAHRLRYARCCRPRKSLITRERPSRVWRLAGLVCCLSWW